MSYLPAIRSIFLGEKGNNLWLFCSLLIFNLLAAFLEGASFGLVLFALSALNGTAPTHFASSFFAWSQLHLLISQRSFIFLMILAISSQILRSILAYTGQMVSMLLGTRIQIQTQKKVYQQILRFSFPFANRYKVGELLEYVKIPSTLIQSLIEPLNQAIASGLMVLSLFIMMLWLSVPLTVVALGVFGFLSFSQKFIIRKISKISNVLSKHTIDFSKHATQSLHALRPIHVFNRQRQVKEQIFFMLHKIAGASKRLNLWSRSIGPLNEMIGILLVGVFLIAGHWIISEQEIQPTPLLLTFIIMIYRLNGRIQLLLGSIGSVAFYWGQILRLEEILKDEDKEFINCEGYPFTSLKEKITFHKASLRYGEAKEAAVDQLNVVIPKGSMVAFVGSSGAGKSSVMDLLLRLYEPTAGEIRVDDVNLTDFEVGSWRERIGAVNQDTFIFNETIEENIRFGLPDASSEKVIEAATMANAHEFIERLPQKYQTTVGERGHRLSGGERQRIALARVLIRNPEILLLDEATSNLDSQSEQLIQKSLDQFRGKKTIVVVAHRLSTILHADRIVVLEKGKTIEQGTHSELLALNGKYASFWNVQAAQKKE